MIQFNKHYSSWWVGSSWYQLEVKQEAGVALLGLQGPAEKKTCIERVRSFGRLKKTPTLMKFNGWNWNKKITQWKKENHLNQTFIFGFHVNFQGVGVL